jgi:hypothetical protein
MPAGPRSALVLGALCAVALLAAPQAAIAGKLKKSYEGPVAAQGAHVFGPPTIQLKIQFERRDGKLVPVSLANFRHRAITLLCPNGKTTAIGSNPGGTTGPGFIPAGGFKVKKRRFAVHLTGEDADSGGLGPNDFLRLNGRVPRQGPLTGTIRITYTLAAGGGTCDSGVINWSASRVPAFSPPP